MQINTKQSPAQLNQIYKEVTEWLASHEYELRNDEANNALIIRPLYDNYRDHNNVVDASTENMQRTISALKKKGVLTFSKQPAKAGPQKPQSTDAHHTMDVAVRDRQKLIDAAKLFQDEQNLTAALYIVENHTAQIHSRRKIQSQQLNDELNKQQKLYAAGKVDGAGVLAAIEKLRGSF